MSWLVEGLELGEAIIEGGSEILSGAERLIPGSVSTAEELGEAAEAGETMKPRRRI